MSTNPKSKIPCAVHSDFGWLREHNAVMAELVQLLEEIESRPEDPPAEHTGDPVDLSAEELERIERWRNELLSRLPHER